MANLTAASTDTRGREGILEHVMMRPVFNKDYWRGGALILRRTGSGTAGMVDRTVDGTLDGTFAGVVAETMKPRDENGALVAQTVIDANKKYRVNVRRRGSHIFNRTSTETFTVPVDGAVGDVGKRVFLTSDNEVSLTPPSQDWPLSPGRIIDVISTTKVEVELDPGYYPEWKELGFGGGSIAAVAAATDVEILTDFNFEKRVFVREITFVVQAPVAGANLDDIRVDKDATEIGTAGTPVIATTDVAGSKHTRALNTVFEPGETLSVILGSDGDPTGGELSVLVRYLDIS